MRPNRRRCHCCRCNMRPSHRPCRLCCHRCHCCCRRIHNNDHSVVSNANADIRRHPSRRRRRRRRRRRLVLPPSLSYTLYFLLVCVL